MPSLAQVEDWIEDQWPDRLVSISRLVFRELMLTPP